MSAAAAVVPIAGDGYPVQVGRAVRLVALDAMGNPVPARWLSSDTSVLAVSPEGVVRGVRNGSATITASTRAHSVTAAISTTRPVAPSLTPADGIYISPGEAIQAIVSASPEGSTFVVRTGVHRMQSFVPKDGQSFIGEPGAVLSGARLLTSFVREGPYWVATGQTQQGQVHGRCRAGYERCAYPEELFLDDVRLHHVSSLAEVAPGRWYFDYAADRIYFADDPTGRRVETSVTRWAITGSASNVTIRGLTIEKYATPAQHGAIQGLVGTGGAPSTGWVVEQNVVRWNHGTGLRIGNRMQVLDNRFLGNGQLGVGGDGEGVLVAGNEIAYNNTAGVEWEWEAGGSKFVLTSGLVVRGNHVHHNQGPGLWTDVDNIHTLYEGNLVEDNENMGIFHEISYAAVIRNNIVRRNGFAMPVWLWGAGILVAASSDVEIYGNTVSENADGIALIQQSRGAGAYGPHVVKNAHVHGNTIAMSTGSTGMVQDLGDASVFARNIRFAANSYVLSGHARYFAWMDAERTDAEWKSYGNDLSGSFRR